MERPLIATNVPGCKEVVIVGKNGFLVRPKDSDDLYEKMKKMINLSSAQRENMGIFGKNFVIKNYDEKIVIDSYLNEMGFASCN